MAPRIFLVLVFLLLAPGAGDVVGQSVDVDSVRTLLAGGKAKAAMEFASLAVEARPEDAGAHCALALARNAARQLEPAIESGERCVELAPAIAAYQLILGESLMELAGERGGLGAMGPARRGKAAVERAIELDPDNVAARLQLFFFHINAPAIAGGSKDEAQRQADEIRKRDPAMGVWAAYRLRLQDASDEERTGFFNEALPLIGTAADSEGYAAGTATNAAATVKSETLSEKLVAQLYQAHASDPRVRYARARLWALQGTNLDEAAKILEAYVTLPELPPFSPAIAGAHWRLGVVYEKQGRKNEALEQYQTAVTMAPDFQQAKEDLERLEEEVAGN